MNSLVGPHFLIEKGFMALVTQEQEPLKVLLA